MIETGMTHTVEKTVTADMTAKAIGSGGLEVLGTPYMMALMECAAMWCVQNELPELAVRTEGGWRLTPKGFLVSNSIIAALQEALGQQKAARLAAAAEGDFRVV